MMIHFHCRRTVESRRTSFSVGPYHAWIMVRGWFVGYLIR